MNIFRNIRLRSFIIFACLTNAASAQSQPPNPRGDTQSWNEVQFTVPFNEQVELTLSGEFRLGRNLGDFVDERVGASLRFKLGKYFEFSPGYEYILKQPDRSRNTFENRLSFAGTVKIPVGRFTVENRNQFERRLRNSQSDTTRYRNRLLISRPVKIGGVELDLFASEEVFYDWSENDWTRSRFSVGGEKKFSEQFTLEVYYTRQNDGFGSPGDLHIIGTTFKLRK